MDSKSLLTPFPKTGPGVKYLNDYWRLTHPVGHVAAKRSALYFLDRAFDAARGFASTDRFADREYDVRTLYAAVDEFRFAAGRAFRRWLGPPESAHYCEGNADPFFDRVGGGDEPLLESVSDMDLPGAAGRLGKRLRNMEKCLCYIRECWGGLEICRCPGCHRNLVDRMAKHVARALLEALLYLDEAGEPHEYDSAEHRQRLTQWAGIPQIDCLTAAADSLAAV